MHWISTYACISIIWKVSRNYVQTIQAVVGFVRTFKMQKHLQLFVLGLWHSYREVVFDLYLQNTFAFCTSTHLTLTFWSINNRMSGKLSTCRVDLSLTVFELYLYKHELYLSCTNMTCICDVQTLKNPWNFIPAVLWGKRFVRSTFGIHYTESESILYLNWVELSCIKLVWTCTDFNKINSVLTGN